MSRGIESSYPPPFIASRENQSQPFYNTLLHQQMAGVSMWAETAEAGIQYAQFLTDRDFYMGKTIPQAKEHQDLIGAPGFMTGNISLAATSMWLERAGGHRMHFAPIGINLIQMSNLDGIEKMVIDVVTRTGKSSRIVGHSAGGMLGFITAMHLHDRYKRGELAIDVEPVSHLYTFGSPVSPEVFTEEQGSTASEAVRGLAEVMMKNDPRAEELQAFKPYLFRNVPSAIRVTNYYSNCDRIVSPQFSIREDSENIEVGGAHTAMIYNKLALQNLGESLAA